MKKILLTILFSTFAITVMCQEILTIGEVFNFNIQDEFHITNLWGFPNGHKATVTDKWYSDTNDSVYYSIDYEKYHSEYDDELEIHYSTSSEVVMYTNLDSSIFTYHDLAELPEDSSLFFKYDSLIYIDSILCNRQINGFDRQDGDFESTYAHFEYGKGLGVTYQKEITSYIGEPDWEYKLVYYKKDGLECGTPDGYLTSIESSVGTDSRFEVYPTIVQNWVYVKDINSSNLYEISLIDLSGSTLITVTNLSGDYSLNLEGIPSGLHIIMIQSNKSIFTKRIIKE